MSQSVLSQQSSYTKYKDNNNNLNDKCNWTKHKMLIFLHTYMRKNLQRFITVDLFFVLFFYTAGMRDKLE